MEKILDNIKPGIEKGFIKPTDVTYGLDWVFVGSYGRFDTDKPRLLFAKILQLFKCENRWATWQKDEFWFGGRTSTVRFGTRQSPKSSFGEHCVIGSDGFGYEQDEDGSLFHIPHLGRVVIEDNVTIHNNTCIDRGVIGDTVIGEGTKIDNLVHVAHNVKIGKRCLIISNCNIGGSSEIGDNVYMGMSVTVINKVRIGKNVKIGAGALILKDIPDDYPDWVKGVWKGI